jgi:hypothetical protein
MRPITPGTVTVARVASMALIGLSVIQSILAARTADWAAFDARGTGVAVFTAILLTVGALIGIGVLAIPLLLIRRGSRITAVAMTLIALWQTSLAVASFDVLGVISAAVAIAGTVAIWMPPSRAHLTRVRDERLARRRETVYPQRRR